MLLPTSVLAQWVDREEAKRYKDITYPAMLAVGAPGVTNEIQNLEQISKMRRLAEKY